MSRKLNMNYICSTRIHSRKTVYSEAVGALVTEDDVSMHNILGVRRFLRPKLCVNFNLCAWSCAKNSLILKWVF